MKVFILSFDALEHDFIEKYGCKNLQQLEYGKVDLEYYLDNRPKGRGSGDPDTIEVYSTLLTAAVPTDSYNELQARMRDHKVPTIFSFVKPYIVIDCPVYGPKSWIHKMVSTPLFSGYWKGKFSLDRAERAHYKHMDIKADLVDIIKMQDYELVFIYFKAPDHLQHMYNHPTKYEDRYEKLYKTIDGLAGRMVEALSDDNTLVLFHSDHGVNGKGGHSHHGFWSSNKPLGKGKNINLMDWFKIIKEWINKLYETPTPKETEPVFTTEEQQIVLDRLRKLGYFE